MNTHIKAAGHNALQNMMLWLGVLIIILQQVFFWVSSSKISWLE